MTTGNMDNIFEMQEQAITENRGFIIKFLDPDDLLDDLIMKGAFAG